MERIAMRHMEQVKVKGPIATTDWEYVSSLAQRGPFVCLDAFGQDKFRKTLAELQEERDAVKELLGAS